MAEGGGEKTGGSTPDVFISYASLDSAIAESACEALERARVSCWIAPRDVTPGAFYADEIVHAIDAAKAIVLILSQNAATSSHVLREVERAASKRHAVISLRVDKAALPPGLEYFLNTSHWLDASSGDTVSALPKLVSAVKVAIQAPAVTPVGVPTAHSSLPAVSARSPKKIGIIVAVAIGLGLLAFASDRLWVSHQQAAAPLDATPARPPSAVFSPPPHSIAVLPFVNMSGDKEQEYFSEGLTEELLNSLSSINELQVAARTSSFSFQGEHPDIATVAHKLNVGAVLEGSVRRSANTVRITTQLVNGVTGFHIWSQTYDRNLGDVLKLQTEIATAVASALKVTLLGNEAAKIEVGGTRNPAALDAYLRASSAYWTDSDKPAAIAAYTEAIRLDPDYALAYSSRSIAQFAEASAEASSADVRAGLLDKAYSDARKAIALAPALGEGHIALAGVHVVRLEYAAASEEYKTALALAPGNARVLLNCGEFAARMGRGESGLAMIRRAVALDPVNIGTYESLGSVLLILRRYAEAIAAFRHAEVLRPDCCSSAIGWTYYALGEFENARSYCAKQPDDLCLALAENKLGRHADAEAALARLRGSYGDRGAYGYALIYAQWGNITEALRWLETALRLQDSGLDDLKTQPFLDPLRNEPRFQAIERALRFPPQ
jgi:TolB-like protein/cytochrome c-type biogenesis protein CcmH/NrfG